MAPPVRATAATIISSDDALLNEAARDAVMGLRFIPAVRDGLSVSGRVDVPVAYMPR